MATVTIPVSPEIKGMGNEVFALMARRGPLDLTQVVVETLISEDRILQVRDYLLEQKLIQERPDKGREHIEDPILKVYGLQPPQYWII